MTPITTALSATSLNNHNPWKPRESELRRLARHWRRFCSDQNTDRQYRGEAPFCSATQRDQAFLKLMRVARGGDEQRDNGRRKCGGWGYEDGGGDVETLENDDGGKEKGREVGGMEKVKWELGEMEVEVGGNVNSRMVDTGEWDAVSGRESTGNARVEWTENVDVVDDSSSEEGAVQDEWDALMLVRTKERKAERHDSKDIGKEGQVGAMA